MKPGLAREKRAQVLWLDVILRREAPRDLFFLLGIAAAGLIAYLPSFSGRFIFDDLSTIAQNPNLRHLWPFHRAWLDSSVEAFTQRPLLRFSFALNYAFGGLNVWGYHAFNLSVHLASACLLFGLVRRTLRMERLRPRYERSADALAFAAALLWVVHPLTTQSVTFIFQRAESLMGFFYLLTLYGLARSAQSARPSLWRGICVVSCALGMGTKQVMVTAPILAVLYDRVFLAASFREVWRQRRGLHAALAGTWLVLVFLFWVDPPIRRAGVDFGRLTFWKNLVIQSGALLHYLRLSVWPHPLLLDYSWPAAQTFRSFAPVGLLLIPPALAGSLWAFWARPPLGFLGIAFFLILAPTSLIPMPREVAAEQRMYLPLAVLITGAVLLADRFRPAILRLEGRRLRSLAAALLLAAVGLAWLTYSRNRMYQDPVRMWRDAVLRQPRSPYAVYNLGIVLLREKRFPEAADAFRQATDLTPYFPDAHWNRGFALEQQGRVAEAELFKGVAQAQLGNHAGAAARFGRALALKPRDAVLHQIIGVTWARAGQWDEAVAHFEEALRLDSGSVSASKRLKDALRERDRRD